MRQFMTISKALLLPLFLGMGQVSVYAQSSPNLSAPPAAANPFFLTRAKNLARQAAERQNGGLNLYRAEVAMYGPAVDAPHRQNPDGSITFTFKGGTPGFVTPTVETVANVTPQGLVKLQYNGPLRSIAQGTVQSTSPQTQQPTPSDNRLTDTLEKPVLIPSSQPLTPNSPPPVSPPSVPKVPSNRPPTSSGLPTLQPAPGITPSQTLPPISSQPQTPTITPSQTLPPISSQPQTPAITPETRPGNPPVPTLLPSIQSKGINNDLFLARAKNLARQAGINANGGLAQYRPESSMFGPAAGTPHQKNQDGSITFRFQGGVPGYQTPTVESIVTVTPNNTVTVTYNGPIRP